MIGGSVVRKRVLAVINERITEKQKEYAKKAKDMDIRCKNDIKTMKTDLVKNKAVLLDKTVDSIIGKII